MSKIAASPDLDGFLETATTEALESMCFFGVMGPIEEMPDGEERISARLSFQGDANGVFHSTLDSSAAWAIAANFLGEEVPDITLSHVQAGACGPAKKICGAGFSLLKKSGHLEVS